MFLFEFFGDEKYGISEPKSWWKYDIYWLLKSSCFDLFGNEKYGIFWAKKLMERWYLLVAEKFLFWTFWWWKMRPIFQLKGWWKDDIYLVFLSFSNKFQVHTFCGFPVIDQGDRPNLQKEIFFGQILIKD